MNPYVVQAIGFIGLFCVFASFQKNKRSFTLLWMLCAGVAFMLHYALLQAWTGAAMNGLSAMRSLTFHLRDSRPWIHHPRTMYVFVLAFWIAGAWTWQGPVSALPVISMTIECFALWDTHTRRIRWLFLSARPGWILYNIIVGSYAGLATEVFIILSLLIAMVRFDVWPWVRRRRASSAA
jgi:hypothetical protein